MQVFKPQIIKTQKISPDTNFQKTYTNIKHKIFKELVPSVLPLLKKHTRLGHTGLVDHSVDLSMPNYQKINPQTLSVITFVITIIVIIITTFTILFFIIIIVIIKYVYATCIFIQGIL